jgi:5'(3')-deoxyribonucleotidase
MTKSRIAIDVDDTIAGFREAYRAIIERLHQIEVDPNEYNARWDVELGHKLTPAQIKACWDEMSSPGAMRELKPIHDAVLAINYLATDFEIVFVSKPPATSTHWLVDRRAWLQRHFAFLGEIHFIATGSKFMVDADFLVEDNVEWAKRWLQDRTERDPSRPHNVVIYAWPYNEAAAHEAGFTYRNRWADIADFIIQCDGENRRV